MARALPGGIETSGNGVTPPEPIASASPANIVAI